MLISEFTSVGIALISRPRHLYCPEFGRVKILPVAEQMAENNAAVCRLPTDIFTEITLYVSISTQEDYLQYFDIRGTLSLRALFMGTIHYSRMPTMESCRS